MRPIRLDQWVTRLQARFRALPRETRTTLWILFGLSPCAIMVASGWGWKYPIYGDKMYSEVSILLTNRSARAIRVRFEPAPFYEGIRSIPAGETGIAWSGNEDQLPEGLVFVIIGARDERELERLRVEGLPKRGFPDGKAKEWTLVYDEPRGR